MSKRYFLLLLAVIAFLVAIAASTTMAAGTGTGNSSDSLPNFPHVERDRLASEISFRKVTGLPADEEIVKDRIANNEVAEPWGFALTPEEIEYMKRLDDIQGNLDVINEYATQNAPDSYAGLFIDDQKMVNVGFTRDTEMHLDNIKSIFKYPEAVKIFKATYSKSELDNVVNSINEEMSELNKDDTTIYSVGRRFRNNRVLVTVPSTDNQTVDYLANKYGQIITFEDGEAPETDDRWNDPWPWKGGIMTWQWIQYPYTYRYCSDAFTAWTIVNGQPYYFVLTAGHCYANWSWATHYNWPMYQITLRSWPGPGGHTISDSEAIYIGTQAPSNLILADEDYMGGVRYHEIRYRVSDYEGQYVCKAALYGYECGTVLDDDYFVYYPADNIYLDHAGLASYHSYSGDSGGSVYQENFKAVGINSGHQGGTSYGIYTEVNNMVQNLGLGIYFGQ